MNGNGNHQAKISRSHRKTKAFLSLIFCSPNPTYENCNVADGRLVILHDLFLPIWVHWIGNFICLTVLIYVLFGISKNKILSPSLTLHHC